MKKRTQKKTKRATVRIICAFGVITKERFEALPEPVKYAIGRVIHDFRIRQAEQLPREQEPLKIAA